MARQRPKKHGLLKFGKSHSTSNTPPGSLQVPAVDTASTTKTSGNGFRGSLTGMRRFFSRSNHSQPSSVAPEIVGTSAGGGTQEQQEQPQITPAQDNQLVINETEPEPALGVDDAERAFNNTDPMSRLSEGPVNIINDANTAFTDILNLTDMYLVPFKLFNTMVTTLYGVHPYAQIALGVLTAASGLLIEQANLDMAVFGLLQAIRTVYIFLMEEDTISNIDSMEDTLVKIARVISDSVQLIKDYSETKTLWKRFGKNIGSETQDIVNDYTTALNDLTQQYRDHAARDIQISVHHILNNFHFEGMAYADGAGLDTAKICLNGTRTELMRRIINWVTDPGVDAPNIMWLQGQAGRGKSAIAHTIAAWIKDAGGFVSCFCFSRDRLAEHREEMIMTTIARDLADCDSAFRRALADVVFRDYSLETTGNVAQQWQQFILEPLSKVNGVIVGNVVVVIDALDESGTVASRSHILPLLASLEVGQLPTKFRILLTSRLLPDIEDALGGCQHVAVMSLDDVPLESAEHDIHLFVANELRHPHLKDVIGPKEIVQITQKSDGLFEWARSACDFIKRERSGQALKERFDDVITLQSGEGGMLLDKTYITFLRSVIPPTNPTLLARFRSVMRQILMSLITPAYVDIAGYAKSLFQCGGSL